MWVSFLPFNSDVVQLIHGGQMTTNHLLISADERVWFDLEKGRKEPWMLRLFHSFLTFHCECILFQGEIYIFVCSK